MQENKGASVLQNLVCCSLKCTWRWGGNEALLDGHFRKKPTKAKKNSPLSTAHTQHDLRWNWTSACTVRILPPAYCLWHSLESRKGKPHAGTRGSGSILCSFFNLGDGDGWWTPWPGRFTSRKQTRYPRYRRPQTRFGCGKSRPNRYSIPGQPSPKQVTKPTELFRPTWRSHVNHNKTRGCSHVTPSSALSTSTDTLVTQSLIWE